MSKLQRRIETELQTRTGSEITGFAQHLAQQHGPGVAAIIAYGSAIRGTPSTQTLLDFYLLCDDFSAVTSNRLAQAGCRLMPPNVYYAEWQLEDVSYRCKYAAMTITQLAQRTKSDHRNPYFWARFAQPCRLVYCRDHEAHQTVVECLAQAVETALGQARRLAGGNADAEGLWTTLLQYTYASELRAERANRPRDVYAANASYYKAICGESISAKTDLTTSDKTQTIERDWRARIRAGKLYSIARLLKAAFTFQGGADYLAWKISRHSGEELNLTAWQRRHPILTSLMLLPKLLRTGSVR